MLPHRLLECERTRDARIFPRWLAARDEPWLRELVHEASAAAGRPVSEVDERIVDSVAPIARRHGAGRRLVAAAWAVERRRWSCRTSAPVPPRTIRRLVFALAAERPRDEAIATAAAELGLDAVAIETSLYADRPRAKLLVAPTDVPTAQRIVDAYNLASVQTLLGRGTEITAVVRSNLRRVVGQAKLLGLMATFDESDDGATLMTLSGPMALFHETVKYGNALARWFPVLVGTVGWALRATIVLGGATWRFDLDASSPVPRVHAMPRAHDSRLEAMLEIDVRRMAPSWRIEREVGIIRVRSPGGSGHKLAFPDFALTSERGRVLVEIVGYWTKDYLAGKRAMMDAAGAPLVMCIDERYAAPELVGDPRVVLFRKRIDPRALIAASERLLGRGRAHPAFAVRNPPMG